MNGNYIKEHKYISEIVILNQLNLITVDGFKRALNKLIYFIIILQ